MLSPPFLVPAKRKWRIMVVTPLGEGGRGGIDRIMDNIRAQLAFDPPSDLEVSFITTRGQGHILFSIILVARVALRLSGAAFGLGPDLVHINLAQDGSAYRKAFIAGIARLLGIPYVIHLHGSRFRQSWDEAPPFVAERMRNFFLHAARILVLGRIWQGFVQSKVPESEARIEILPNASASAPPRSQRREGKEVVILFLGIVNERKGVPTLIEALAGLRNEPTWRAIIAGNGEVAATQARVRELGLADLVLLPGWVGPDEVGRLLREADILVLPSQNENLPMSVIEGMANGLAVVTTPVGAVEDIIFPDKTGLLVQPRDSIALMEALQRLICDPALRDSLGENARSFHTEHLEIGAYYQKLLTVWRREAGRGRQPETSFSSGASSRLAWALQRVRSMSPMEIASRCLDLYKKTACRFTPHEWTGFTSSGGLPALGFLKEACFRNLDEESQRALREQASGFLSGSFQLHGAAWPKRDPEDLFPPQLWFQDPVRGGLWPGRETYCFDIDYRSQPGHGDVKYVWDLNRLQWLPPLALAAALWNDARALTAVETAIASWSDANPPFRGINWTSGIELAIRAVSLIFVASVVGERLSETSIVRLRAILAAQFNWLIRFPSRFSSANNHRICEALGVFVIALAMPELDPDRRHLRKAKASLEMEAELQILVDGVGAEQSPHYAAFTAEMLLFAAFLARECGEPLAGVVQARLVAFGEHCAWLANHDGETPSIGDDDGGYLLMPFSDSPEAYPASVANCIAAFFGLRSFMSESGATCGLRQAVFGRQRSESQFPQGLRCFGAGGYTIVRETRAGKLLHLVFDHGPLGYLSIAAHGHADALSAVLSLDDVPVLVDPGTYLYHSGGAWRDWFRGTRAHNTLTVNGADQSVISGPFNWSHKARAHLDSLRVGNDWSISARHDGYVGRFGIEHRREICACADGIEILDSVSPATGALRVEASFQFAPHITLQGEGPTRDILYKGAVLARIQFDPQGEIEIRAGAPELDGGWVSPIFGVKHPAVRLSWRGWMPPEGLLTRIIWRQQ